MPEHFMIYREDGEWCNGVIPRDDLKDFDLVPLDISEALLTKFKLLFGPTSINGSKECYLLPYYMPKHDIQTFVSAVSLQAILGFDGLKVPDYAFHQMTVSFLGKMSPECYKSFPYSNCVTSSVIELGENIDIYLFHEIEAQKVSIQVHGPITVAKRDWKLFVDILSHMSTEFRKDWPMTNITLSIPCPHCIMLEKTNPILMDEKIVLVNRDRHFSAKLRALCATFQQHYRPAEAKIWELMCQQCWQSNVSLQG